MVRTHPPVAVSRRARLATVTALVVALGATAVLAGCGSSHTATSAKGNPSTSARQPPATTTTSSPADTTAATTPKPLVSPTPPGGSPPPGRTYLPASKLATTPEVPVSTGPGASTPAVTVLQAEPATKAAFVQAFVGYASLPASCPVQVAPHTVHVAKVIATGAMIALAGFQPAPACKELYGVSPEHAGPFGQETGPPEYVLQQLPGQQWQVIDETGIPFPCPPVSGVKPLVPEDVLQAWDIPFYSASCLATFP